MIAHDDEMPADGVATSAFRVAIPNPERYMRANSVVLQDVAEACMEGDIMLLEQMLKSGNATQLFNGDLNAHFNRLTPLHYAAWKGYGECVELLLEARADPHMRESVPFGKDPEEARTALEMAKAYGWDDVVTHLSEAEASVPYGYYVPAGVDANRKIYNGFEWGRKPAVGWYFKRPGAARMQGLDPAKFGVDDLSTAIQAPQLKSKGGSLKESSRALPLALIFPGQGSQYVGMLNDCSDLLVVNSMLGKANLILGYDIQELCKEGPEEKLRETQYCQPALYIAGAAAMERLREQRAAAVEECRAVAGLSLGEYTALYAANVINFETGLELVKLRGEAMQEAASQSPQKMCSVAGLAKGEVERLCKEAIDKAGSGEVCQIANELFPNGFSIAGTESAIMELQELAGKAGATQCKELPTSGAFHTPLMSPAAERLGTKLREVQPLLRPPKCSVYMNVTGSPIPAGSDPIVFVDLLQKQLTSVVKWQSSMERMVKDGIQEFHELGPGKQLKAMMKRIDAKAWEKTSNVEVCRKS